MAESKLLVERHGITVTQRSVYHYDGYTYDNLADALAELVRSRADELAGRKDGAARSADRPDWWAH